MELPDLTKHGIVYLIAKRAQLIQQQGSIQTLAVGSSHGDFGFDTQYCEYSFNLCSRSQDLKHSSALYYSLAPSLPALSNLLVFYSVFSSGSFLEKSPTEKALAPALNEVFTLGLHYEDEELAQIAQHIEGGLGHLSFELDGQSGFFPQAQKGFFNEQYGAQRRANDHLKLNARTDANVFLINIFQLAQRLKHRPYIIIPPVRQDYRAACGAGVETLFRDLMEILSSVEMFFPGLNVQLISFFDDEDFKYEDFGDFDHLVPTGDGAKLLAHKIQDIISANDEHSGAASKGSTSGH